MAKGPDKPARHNVLTGAAQPVTNSVERTREYLEDRPEPSPQTSKRRNRWQREDPQEPSLEPNKNKAESEEED
jgi:hypothetical protein